MNQSLKYFILGAIGSLLMVYILFAKACSYHSTPTTITKIDTVYINKPYKVIELKEIEKPIKVTIYKTDTIYRDQLIQDTLITFIEIQPKLAKIHTLSPEGLPLIKDYPLPPSFQKIQINHQGELNITSKKIKHPKFWSNVERIGLLVGGIWLGSRLQP